MMRIYKCQNISKIRDVSTYIYQNDKGDKETAIPTIEKHKGKKKATYLDIIVQYNDFAFSQF